MKSLRWRIMCAVVACGAGCLTGRAATAQSFGGGSPSLGAPSTGATSAGAAEHGKLVHVDAQHTPVLADGAQSHERSDRAGGRIIDPEQHHEQPVRRSVHLQQHDAGGAAPGDVRHVLASSTASTTTSSTTTSSTAAGRAGMMGMSTGQLGLLMLATQNNGGVGSGQMSGAQCRHAERVDRPRRPRPRNAARAARPGGLAARYFNRTDAAHALSAELLQPSESLLPVIPAC